MSVFLIFLPLSLTVSPRAPDGSLFSLIPAATFATTTVPDAMLVPATFCPTAIYFLSAFLMYKVFPVYPTFEFPAFFKTLTFFALREVSSSNIWESISIPPVLELTQSGSLFE